MTEKRPKKGRAPSKEDYPHERITLSVRKGWRTWLRKAADEMNLDVSKLTRLATEDFVKANGHKLSDELRKEFDAIRLRHRSDETHGPLL
jgi:hypothetical protein